MAASASDTIIVDVDTVDQIFNAPNANPFSSSESVVLGEAALSRMLVQLQTGPRQDRKGARLLVRLPGDQITADLEAHFAAALRRYCAARIEANHRQVSVNRRQRSVGLIVAVSVAIVVIVIGLLLLATILADASAFYQTIVGGAVALFAWIIVWGPLEALLFDWAAPARENRALTHIMNMQIVVEPRS